MRQQSILTHRLSDKITLVTGLNAYMSTEHAMAESNHCFSTPKILIDNLLSVGDHSNRFLLYDVPVGNSFKSMIDETNNVNSNFNYQVYYPKARTRVFANRQFEKYPYALVSGVLTNSELDRIKADFKDK